MKQYNYKYCVYYNNLCAGVAFVCAFDRLADALRKKDYIQNSGGGCCDVVKKRFRAGSDQPITKSIYNNYRFSEYDLFL